MRYVHESQGWTGKMRDFWGEPEDAEKFMEKLVADVDVLDWVWDSYLKYVSATLSRESPISKVTIVTRGIISEMWVSTIACTSPSVLLNQAPVMEDLMDHVAAKHLEARLSSLEQMKNVVTKYAEA